MDAERFDTLIRSLVAASSRRRVLGALVSAVSAGVPLALAGSVAAKKKRRKKCKQCRGKAQGEACLTNKECCANETHLACAFTSGGGPRCCGVGGTPCGEDSDCCLGFECLGSGRCGFLL